MITSKLKIPCRILFLTLLCLLLSACQPDTGIPEMLERELIDYEMASELFGHKLVPCTVETFQRYSLDGVINGRDGDVIYTHANYHFSNGMIQIRDIDRDGGSIDWFLMDTDSISYNEKTFYIKDASLEGYTSVQYLPNGESGLSYGACFPTEMELNEVFDLLLSLQIPD